LGEYSWSVREFFCLSKVRVLYSVMTCSMDHPLSEAEESQLLQNNQREITVLSLTAVGGELRVVVRTEEDAKKAKTGVRRIGKVCIKTEEHREKMCRILWTGVVV
jgi:hypothetical protein